MTPRSKPLFPELDAARYGDARQKRPLFLPNELKRESIDKRLDGPTQEQAYAVILRWAELESSGKLEEQVETTLEAEFLTEVFGKALGYTLFSEGLKQWNLKPKFYVNGGQADAAIGIFESGKDSKPRAIIEFKGPTTNVDRDRFNGRTPVDQCWGYLDDIPKCSWGIVCNFVSFRLYHRNHTRRVYELFTLHDLLNKEKFLQFYYLFQRDGLLPATMGQIPRADALLEASNRRERTVGDELYRTYHENRLQLIRHLCGGPHNKTLDIAIRIAQKLIDRVVFVAFCEDRGLLPSNSLSQAWEEVPPFHRGRNPRWKNFIDLFHSIDRGNDRREIPPYDGGLFAEDHEVDNLDLDDDWAGFFKSIGEYDFRYEVNVDVLGHLFEKSINDIEKVRLGGIFDSKAAEAVAPKMGKSAERKRGGIYYTPPEFTEFITHNTVAAVADEKIKSIAERYGIDPQNIKAGRTDGELTGYAVESIDALRQIKVVDPACGSGAFLIKACEVLEDRYHDLIRILESGDPKQAERLQEQISEFILHDNLFGVDLSQEAVEITQLALWLRSARRGRTLADLSKNIVRGNSLVSDPQVDPHALNWQTTFPEIFSREGAGFDCVIGNPPWERMKLQEREFFDTPAAEIASTVSAADRRQLIEKLKKLDPLLYERYIRAKDNAEKTLDYVRNCGRFPLTGRGDINTYAVFAEIARSIVAPSGRVGLLVPSGIATDDTTKDFFAELVDSEVLAGLYDFENKKPYFPDVHRSYKFCVLLFGGSQRRSDLADFVFFAHTMEDVKNTSRHISLTSADFKLLNPNTRTCPVFRSRRDAELTRAIYRRVPILIDKTRKKGGNPWGIKFLRMFDQTNDAELFHTAEQLKAEGFKRDGPIWKKRKQVFVPLYEAKMIQMYDHRAASVVVDESNWMRQGQTDAASQVEHQNPEFFPEPRWWVNEEEVSRSLGKLLRAGFIGFKDITSPTNERTMIGAAIPWAAVTNHFPLILTSRAGRLNMCLLANLNSIILDYVARQKIGGVTLNFYLVQQFPIFSPDFYAQRCPWNKRQTLEKWISDRVLKLTCMSNDMIPLAEAAGFDPPVHKWEPIERAELMAELDAAFFLLYGIDRDDAEYILSTFSGIVKEQPGLIDGSTTFERILRHYESLCQSAGEKRTAGSE